MASKKKNTNPKAKAAKRKPAGALRRSRGAEAPAAITELNARRALWTLIDLATSWELAVSRGGPVPHESTKGAPAALLRIIGHLETTANELRQEFGVFAFSSLADVLGSIYADRVAGNITHLELKNLLRAAWREHPATQLLLHEFTEGSFVSVFAISVADKTSRPSIRELGGPKDAAIALLAEAFSRKPSTGWNMNRRLPATAVRPFGVAATEATRVTFTLSALFPDIDVAPVARAVLAAVSSERSGRDAPTPKALERMAAIQIPWPPSEVIDDLKRAEDTDARFVALARMLKLFSFATLDPISWARARFSGDVGPDAGFDEQFAAWVRSHASDGDGGEDLGEFYVLEPAPTQPLTEEEEQTRRRKIIKANERRWRR